MRIVAALGGNALLRRGDALGEARMRDNIRAAARALAPIALRHQLAVTHGNGPQIGIIALQNDAGPAEGRSGIDVLGAQSQGQIGYMIEQELRNALPDGRAVAALLTQVLVDSADPAFRTPSKPIGLQYDAAVALKLQAERGWTMMRDGDRWRRAVASPRPLEILEAGVIERLVANDVVTVCVGGGGVPVARSEAGEFHGLEAVVDKDFASALLARNLKADALLLLTDVDAVYEDWGDGNKRPLRRISAASVDPQHYEAGTMRPKMAAAREFALATGKPCVIGALEDAFTLLDGIKGTTISSAGG